MTQLLKIILRGKKVGVNYGFQNLTERQKMLTVRCCTFTGVTSPCQLVQRNYQPDDQHSRNKHFEYIFRTFTSNTKSNNNGSRVIVIPKSITRLGKKRKIREALEDRQRKIRKGMENVLEDRRMALTNTRRRIQEKGKLIIQDIKETKEKMKEKLEEVIELRIFKADLLNSKNYLVARASREETMPGFDCVLLIGGPPNEMEILYFQKENVYTIPNLLCVTRIGLSPLLGYLIVSQKFEYALAFMIVAGISDWFDGWIARNYKNQSSKIGSFLDPMADKVLIGTLFLTLTYVDLIPVPLTALIIARDVILIMSGFVIRYRSLPPPRTLSRYFDVTHATAQLAPTFISKVNTGVQLVLVATTLAAPVFGYVNHQFLQALWYITAASTVVAATSYIFSKETYKYLKAKEKTKNR